MNRTLLFVVSVVQITGALAHAQGDRVWVVNQELLATAKELPDLLQAPDPDVAYYGAILAGLLKDKSMASPLKAVLEGREAPVYLRKELYQALGNLEDGRQVDFLRQARRLDPPCAEELRDVSRELKRKRIEPIR